jgi:hypothetical protein
LYAARGRLIPLSTNSPTGSTFTAFSTAISTRGLMRNGQRDGRLWRAVPSRRCYSDQRGETPASKEGKKGTPNKLTTKLQATLAQAAQRYDGNALQTLVDIMNDDTATAAARVRCAELIFERAHGKPAYLEDPNRDPDFVPLAERLKAYVRRDQILAAEGKVVQLSPATDQALPPATDQATAGRALSVPSSSPSGAMRRATTLEDDPFGPSWT